MRIDRGIVLAAGASKRLGSHKALIEVEGQTLVQLVCSKLQSAGLSVTVVTRNSLKQKIENLLPNVSTVVNPNPELGRTGTIQRGIESIGTGPLLIIPVDRPGFSLETINLLCKTNTTTIPTYEQKGGHPIAITSQDCENIMQAEPDIPLRELISPERMHVEDPHLHLNIDTKEDVNQLIKVAKHLSVSYTHLTLPTILLV